MPEASMWPQGRMWGLHDFLPGRRAGRRLPSASAIESSYGGAATRRSGWRWPSSSITKGYRAMFEAQSKNRMGLLIWMSHPAWPSFVWQTYDYYFEPTAGVLRRQEGVRAAAHPVEPGDRQRRGGELQRAGTRSGLTARGRDSEHGRRACKWEKDGHARQRRGQRSIAPSGWSTRAASRRCTSSG